MNSKQVNETVNRLVSFMGDVKDGNLREILANMQKMCDYQAEKLRIYEEHLTTLTGKARPELTDSDKRRLAQKGKVLNDFLLASVEPTWAPGTLRGWYNSLVGAKYDSTKSPNQKKRGRKPISQEIVDEVLKLAQNNPDWGYDRIAGTMQYLGYDVCASTVRHILDDHGIVPDPGNVKDGAWIKKLTPCPRNLRVEDGELKGYDENEWENNPKSFALTQLWGNYHPGGKFELRTKKPTREGYGNQCIYDKCGNFIATIPGAGTADKTSPNHSKWDHSLHDVDPFDLARDLDKYYKTDKYVKLYYKVRPTI